MDFGLIIHFCLILYFCLIIDFCVIIDFCLIMDFYLIIDFCLIIGFCLIIDFCLIIHFCVIMGVRVAYARRFAPGWCFAPSDRNPSPCPPQFWPEAEPRIYEHALIARCLLRFLRDWVGKKMSKWCRGVGVGDGLGWLPKVAPSWLSHDSKFVYCFGPGQGSPFMEKTSGLEKSRLGEFSGKYKFHTNILA